MHYSATRHQASELDINNDRLRYLDRPRTVGACDFGTGLNYNYLRYCDPETARYLTPAPLGLEPSDNHHSYTAKRCHRPLGKKSPSVDLEVAGDVPRANLPDGILSVTGSFETTSGELYGDCSCESVTDCSPLWNIQGMEMRHPRNFLI